MGKGRRSVRRSVAREAKSALKRKTGLVHPKHIQIGRAVLTRNKEKKLIIRIWSLDEGGLCE